MLRAEQARPVPPILPKIADNRWHHASGDCPGIRSTPPVPGEGCTGDRGISPPPSRWREVRGRGRPYRFPPLPRDAGEETPSPRWGFSGDFLSPEEVRLSTADCTLSETELADVLGLLHDGGCRFLGRGLHRSDHRTGLLRRLGSLLLRNAVSLGDVVSAWCTASRSAYGLLGRRRQLALRLS